mmetsp:Transcript_15446/g.34071  ORF Transcript_15446/g.34071 Transcript_15446/m.34071 type:complete len:270 (-) Transcript_15446:751-1560(-)
MAGLHQRPPHARPLAALAAVGEGDLREGAGGLAAVPEGVEAVVAQQRLLAEPGGARVRAGERAEIGRPGEGRGLLRDHQVAGLQYGKGVRAPEAVVRYAGGGGHPGGELGDHVEVALQNGGVAGGGVVLVGQQNLVFVHEQALYQAHQPRGPLRMPHAGLYGAQGDVARGGPLRSVICEAGVQHAEQAAELLRVPHGGAGAVRLDVADGLHAHVCVREGVHGVLRLRLRGGEGDPLGREAVVIHAGAAQLRVPVLADPCGLQHHHGDAL